MHGLTVAARSCRHSMFGEPYVIEALKECDLLYCDKSID